MAIDESVSSKNEINRIAVKIDHLDDLLSLTGEVIINSSNLSLLHKGLQEVFDLQQAVSEDSLEMLKIASLTANRISSDLHSLVMNVRMVEIRETFQKFRRLVRDIGKKQGKQITFKIAGEETQVDKTIVERLYDPLNHLIRNAADHGIESPIERKQAKKTEESEIFLNAYSKEKFTIVEVVDDGRGIDLDRVKEKAISLGLLQEEEGTRLTEQEILALLFIPGFTTVKKATDISGRGVGMDVVKNNIASLGGTIGIETKKGLGTKITMKIPQLSAVNITDALTFRTKNSYYAIPINSVVATLGVEQKAIHRTFGKESMLYLGAIVPLHGLDELLRRGGDDAEQWGDTVPIVIVEAKNGRVGLKVAEFLAPQKLVILPLSKEYFHVQGVSGMTIMGGKRVGMIIDPHDLIALATAKTEDVQELQIKSVSDENQIILPPEKEKEKAVTEDIVGEGGATNESGGIQIDSSESEEFFLEIEGLIKEADEAIFLLEKEPDDEETVNTLFRHFHSMKGDMSMIGCPDEIVTFVHHVETILDRVRNHELSVTEEVIDIFLDSVQVVKKCTAQIKKGSLPTIGDQDLLSRMSLYKERESPGQENVSKEEVQQSGFDLTPMEEFTLLHKRLKGDTIYQSYLEFSSSFQENFLVAYLIMKRMIGVGDIIATIPSMSTLEQMSGNSVKLLIASQASPDEFDRFIEEKVKKDYGIIEYQNYVEKGIKGN